MPANVQYTGGQFPTMKRTLAILSAALLTAAIAAPVCAQVPPRVPVNTAYGARHPDVEGFDRYLEQHPEVRGELSRIRG